MHFIRTISALDVILVVPFYSRRLDGEKKIAVRKLSGAPNCATGTVAACCTAAMRCIAGGISSGHCPRAFPVASSAALIDSRPPWPALFVSSLTKPVLKKLGLLASHHLGPFNMQPLLLRYHNATQIPGFPFLPNNCSFQGNVGSCLVRWPAAPVLSENGGYMQMHTHGNLFILLRVKVKQMQPWITTGRPPTSLDQFRPKALWVVASAVVVAQHRDLGDVPSIMWCF